MLFFGAIACFEGLWETYRTDQDTNKKYLFRCAGLAAETIRGVPVLELAGDSSSAQYQECCLELDKIRENMGLNMSTSMFRQRMENLSLWPRYPECRRKKPGVRNRW